MIIDKPHVGSSRSRFHFCRSGIAKRKLRSSTSVSRAPPYNGIDEIDAINDGQAQKKTRAESQGDSAN